jgi:hypothetical protein
VDTTRRFLSPRTTFGNGETWFLSRGTSYLDKGMPPLARDKSQLATGTASLLRRTSSNGPRDVVFESRRAVPRFRDVSPLARNDVPPSRGRKIAEKDATFVSGDALP